VSIWSTVAEVEPVYPVDYSLDRENPIADGNVALADARSWYGPDGVRLSIWDGQQGAEVVIAREQLVELRYALTAWLKRSA
jgi:hypothetical protein